MRELIKKILHEHVNNIQEKRFVWTKDMLRDVANKYKTLNDLIKNDLRGYYGMREKGLFDELTQHLDKSRPKKWTKENVHNIGKKISPKN